MYLIAHHSLSCGVGVGSRRELKAMSSIASTVRSREKPVDPCCLLAGYSASSLSSPAASLGSGVTECWVSEQFRQSFTEIPT